MPREINGIEVLTSQEWMRLGYPAFVASALEALNEDAAEDGFPEQIKPEVFATLTVHEQLDAALLWEGIIGYTRQILDAVRGLDRLKEQTNG